MYTLSFYYSANAEHPMVISVSGVKEIRFYSSELVTLTDAQILSSIIPLNKELYLYGDGFSDTITPRNLLRINVKKEF